jgi:ribosome-binding factor A
VSHRRPQRVAEQIRDDLARLLREELRDPEVGFVTLTDVVLSPDLRHARVYVSVLGDEERVLEALARARSFLRHGLARAGRLRYTPELRFEIDRSATTGQRVDRLLTGAGDGPPEDGSGEIPD